MNNKPEPTLEDGIADAIKADTTPKANIIRPIGQVNPAPLPLEQAGYEHLLRILKLAYSQSSTGKGRARHSISTVGFTPWHNQPILANARQVGAGGPALQVMKKAQEAVTMAGNHNYEGAKAEVLGCIVYAAAMYKLLEEQQAAFGNAPDEQ